MLNRRMFLSILLSLHFSQQVDAEEDDEHSDILEMVKAAQADAQSLVVLGPNILPPNDPAWGEAYSLLSGAPKGVTPFEVAQYFKTSVPSKFQEAWPSGNANPIIVKFFWDMHMKPAGDTTPWCAAFVNWCLRQSGIKGTNSASSQSFVDQAWGKEIWKKGDGFPADAKIGDIAVFRHKSDPAHGHVAFFQAIDQKNPDTIDVLGGNQLERIGGRVVHLIDYRPMGTKGDLELISIRTTDGLGG